MAAPAAAEPRQPSADGVGVYRPRRPRASPLYRLLERHFRELCLVWDERFAASSGDWRAVIPKVVDQFLACGLLEHGFVCDACAHEYLLAFSCKCRYFCPSCHAKRSPGGVSGSTRRCSPRCRIGKWSSPCPDGSGPTVSIAGRCWAIWPASPPAS